MKKMKVHLSNGEKIEFIGKYLPLREKRNWHYYEDSYGALYHFRKDFLMYIEEEDVDE